MKIKKVEQSTEQSINESLAAFGEDLGRLQSDMGAQIQKMKQDVQSVQQLPKEVDAVINRLNAPISSSEKEADRKFKDELKRIENLVRSNQQPQHQ